MSSFSNLVVVAKTASALITAADAALAALANTTRIRAVTYLVPDEIRRLGSEHKLLIEYDTGGVVMSNDWQVNIWEEARFESTISDADAFAAANPGYFVSPVFAVYLAQSRRTKPAIGLSLYNQDGVNGEANWLASGGSSTPTGAAGGDLSGTYPNPVVVQMSGGTTETAGLTSGATVIASYAHATYDSLLLEITLVRTDVSGERVVETVMITHDGTTAYDEVMGQVLVPSAAGNISLSYAISGANIEVTATVTAGTWTSKVRNLSLVS